MSGRERADAVGTYGHVFLCGRKVRRRHAKPLSMPAAGVPTDMLMSETDGASDVPREGNVSTCVSTPGCMPTAVASFGDPSR